MSKSMISVTKDLFYALESLSKDEQIKVYQAFCQFVFDGTEPEDLQGTTKAMWILAKNYVQTSRTNFGQKESKNKPEPRMVFRKPSVQEISEYVYTLNGSADIQKINEFAEQFHAFYESKDWMIGKSKMKNWKAALRTWKDTMQKTIYPRLNTTENFIPKNSWEKRQMEYLKGMNSILNDENP